MSEDKKPKIRIFSTLTCPYCFNLKDYLTEKGFEYQDINVAEDEKARDEMISKTNQMGVPVTEINGEYIIGFDKDKINQILGIK